MLSTDSGGSPSPAPALFPSDRPPDTCTPLTIAESSSLMMNVATATSSSDMAIDSFSLLSVQKQGEWEPMTESQQEQPLAVATSQQRFTYAKAVTGLKPATIK
ncbi:unnamed protein product [Linum trigynum]|uniref:Uncharacterized protein n=1 Tax=Linum trigynum TaxID=586398 RepID=A0AAV2EV65_9ROSI